MHIREVVFVNVVEVRDGTHPGLPRPGQVLMAPDFVGVCGGERHTLHGHHPWTKPPVVPGHEVAATVVKPGSVVTKWAPGDRALLNPLIPCRSCPTVPTRPFQLLRSIARH